MLDRAPGICGRIEADRLVDLGRGAFRVGSVCCLTVGDLEPSAAVELARRFPVEGERVLDGLSGGFALVLHDEARAEGLLAVDPLGCHSLVYCGETGRQLRFAAEIADLLDALPATPPPAPGALARWLATGVLEPDETLYAGVHRLPGGHCLHLRSGRWERRRYWTPRFDGILDLTRPAAARALRAAVERAVERRSAPERLGIMLSGGLDSSSVAAVAATVRGDSRPVHAYSATFPHHPSVDESQLAAATAGRLGFHWHGVAAGAGGVLDAARDHISRWRVPPASPTLFFQLPVLRAAAADGIEVMLDGQGGDELFGCSPFLVADELRRLRVRSAVTLARALAGTRSRRVVRRALKIYGVDALLPRQRAASSRSSLLRPELAHLVTPERPAWARLDGPRWWTVLADQLTAGRERFGAHEHLRLKFASVGLRGAHPYFHDLELIELVLRLPPQLGFDPVYDRPLLREALAEILHDDVRLRRDKSYFDLPLAESLRGPDRQAVERLLGAPDAAVRDYVRSDALEAAMAPPPENARSPWAWRLWRLASTEQWLRSDGGAGAAPQ